MKHLELFPPTFNVISNTLKESVIDTKQLSIGYKGKTQTTIVGKQLNLQLKRGELTCLLGPNGAGKTTLMRTLAGLQPTLGGSVLLENIPIETFNKKQLAKKMSLVLTENLQAGNLSVYTIITLGRYPYLNWFGQLKENDKVIIKQAIKLTGVAPFLEKKISQLSDGEKQKVMITRALVQETPLIILDEPTAHLDLPNRVVILRLLRNMARTTNKAILLSTHELDLALQASDKVWLMMPNKTIKTGAPEDLILQGSFEAAFQKEGIQFDRYSGTFKMHKADHNKTIRVEGGNFANFWTRRALEKLGFEVNNNSSFQLEIHEEKHDVKWSLKTNEKTIEFFNIESLINYLRE